MSGTVFNTFAFNGTVLDAQPTTHGWVHKEPIGIDGNGIAIYPNFGSYEMRWDFLSTDQFDQIYDYFNNQGTTGSVVAALPKWHTSPYQFYSYSGSVLREPEYKDWFQNYYTDTKLLIVRILV
jgi:hypothetical protein